MAGSRTVPRLPTKVPSPVTPDPAPKKVKWYIWLLWSAIFIIIFIILIWLGTKVKEQYEDDDEKKKFQ
jgi:hypothetical protein